MAKRMENASATVWAAAIGGISALIVAVANVLLTRRKSDAEATDILTGSALSIVTALERRVNRLEVQLALQEETIKYLWDGIGVLTEQVEELGAEPRFKPEPKFRGPNGDEFNFE
jgi:hypothetical protein